jgi:hypothetical protein
MLKAEKVVKPPQNPVVRKAKAVEGRELPAILPYIRPMIHEPTILTKSVAKGNDPVAAGAKREELSALATLPAEPPSAIHSSVFIVLLLCFLLEHFQHAVGNNKTAYHVQRTKHYGYETKDHACSVRRVRVTHYYQCSDDHNAVNSVCTGHQRCVKNGRNFRDYLDTHEYGKDNDVDHLDVL